MGTLLFVFITISGTAAYTKPRKGLFTFTPKGCSMHRYAIFVDAGYFFAAGAQAALGKPIPRKQITLKSPSEALSNLRDRACAAANNLDFLRTYWYDAMPGPRLSLEQSELAMLPGVKLRLGALNTAGEQKGVDSLIVTDLIDLARNRAIVDAIVVSGDEDLRIAVEVAQSFGVRVHILAAGDSSKNVSLALRMAADSVTTLDADWFVAHLDLQSPVGATLEVPAVIAPSCAADMQEGASIRSAAITVAEEMLDAITPERLAQLVQHFSAQTSVPPEYDRPLVAKVSAALSDKRFTGPELRDIRGVFVRAARFKHSAALSAAMQNPPPARE